MEKIKIATLAALAATFLGACSCSTAPKSQTSNNPSQSSIAPQAGSFWRSEDGGKTWVVRNIVEGETQTQPEEFEVLSIAINPTNDMDVMIGLKKGGILRSDNGGNLWKKTNFTSEKVYGLAFDPQDEKTIYASGVWNNRGKIWKSTDGGGKWEEIYSTAKPEPLVISLMIDSLNPKTLYITTSDNQLLKSSDGGINWKNLLQDNSPILKVAVDSKNNQLVYFVNLDGEIWRSRDGGSHFENISENIDKEASTTKMTTLEANPSIGQEIYAGGEAGLYVSQNSGDVWQKIRTLADPEASPVRTISLSPTNLQEILYAASQAVYFSGDKGASWKTFQLEGEQRVNVMERAWRDTNILYLGLKNL